MVQRPRQYDPISGSLGSIPGQGTRSNVEQLKMLHVAMKMEDLTCSS